MSDLPPELKEIARINMGFSRDYRDIWNEGRDRADSYAPRVTAAYEDAAAGLQPAIDFAGQFGRDSIDRYRSGWAPILDRSLTEMLDAGSAARQQYEAVRAADDFRSAAQARLEEQQRRAGRVGYSGAVSPFNAQNAIQMAGMEAGGMNRARYAERERGEAVRRGAVPMAIQEGQNTISRAAMPSALQQQRGQYLAGASAVPAALYQPFTPFATDASNFGGKAYDQFSNIWSGENLIKQHNTNRRNNMITTGLNLAGNMIAPGFNAGSMLRGGGANMGTGAGAGAFPSFSNMASWFGGGGGMGQTNPGTGVQGPHQVPWMTSIYG